MPEEQTGTPIGSVDGRRAKVDMGPPRLRRMDHPLGGFLAELLALQCRCCRARQGVVLQIGAGQQALLAVHPTAAGDPELGPWLDRCASVAERTLTSGAMILSPVNGDSSAHAVIAPLRLGGGEPLATALLLRPADRNAAEATRQLLELMAGVVAMTEQHLARHGQDVAGGRLQQALSTLAAVNRQNRFRGVAMALCNEMAVQWRCERVSLGLLKGRYVQVAAMNHTEQFSRKLRLVQDIEAAMEECLDQDCEILYPSAQTDCISRAAAELSAGQGGKCLLSVPLRHEGKPCAAITLERVAGQPFGAEELEAIRLACDLETPRLMNLHQYDRWFGARAVAAARRSLGMIVGPQYTWAKIAGVAAFAFILFVFFAKGWHRVKAPFIVEAVSQYKIAAPFDGFLKSVQLEVGDSIEKDRTALAELDTAELRLELAAAKAERAGFLKQSDAAMRDGKTAEAQIAEANADKAQSQIDLLTHRIEKARLLSPVSGTLVTGDLKRQIGAPVQTGQILFEVAPLDSLRAELYVSEDEVLDLSIGLEGKLATATYPGQYIPFVVERINPAAEVVNNRNVFKVKARLLESRPWLRPGMEGVAKVTVEKRSYAWIWSRKVANWIRMKLWI